MTRISKCSAITVLALLGLGQTAGADTVLYSNGPLNNGTESSILADGISESFTLSNAATVTR